VEEFNLACEEIEVACEKVNKTYSFNENFRVSAELDLTRWRWYVESMDESQFLLNYVSISAILHVYRLSPTGRLPDLESNSIE
jgi:hypothetical protein